MKQDVQVSEQDVLYLFSDGYYDQFGGPSGKKFKYKQLTEKFRSLAYKPLSEQKKILSESFDNWRGNLEQLDDVCIIGIKM
jgi:serine phosphatase RsbU (regulator of sigma subunit)